MMPTPGTFFKNMAEPSSRVTNPVMPRPPVRNPVAPPVPPPGDNYRSPMQRANGTRPELLDLLRLNGRPFNPADLEENMTEDRRMGFDQSPMTYRPRAGTGLAAWAQKYPGMINTINDIHGGGAESGQAPGAIHQVDWTKLPKTRFGSAEDAYSLEDGLGKGQHLIDPRMVYDDPVYGRITHRSNLYEPARGLNKYMPMLTMAAMAAMTGGSSMLGLAGAGSVAGPMLSAGISGLHNYGQTGRFNWGSLAGPALGAGLGAMGAPSWASGLARAGTGMAFSNLNKRPPSRP